MDKKQKYGVSVYGWEFMDFVEEYVDFGLGGD